MALVSPMPVIPQRISPIRYPNVGIPQMMASRGEIVEEPPVQIVDDKIYVAVGKELNENKLNLLWALHNSGGRKICILHIHRPAQRIPMSLIGTKLPVSQLEEQPVRAYREIERQDVNKLLEDYRMICVLAGVHVDLLHIDMDSIEKGIVELITQHGIRRLVMGAAANKHYSKKMMEPKSKKAIYVRLHAPISCHISFVCKGNLVHKRYACHFVLTKSVQPNWGGWLHDICSAVREGRLEGVSGGVKSLVWQASPNTEIAQSTFLRSRSATEVQDCQLELFSPGPDHSRLRSGIHGIQVSAFSPSGSKGITPCSRLQSGGSSNEGNGILRMSHSLNSRISSYSSSEMAEDSALTSAARTEDGFELHSTYISRDNHLHASPPTIVEGGVNDEFYDKLEQAINEAEKYKREAFEESSKRRKAERDAIDAFRKAKTLENWYFEELRQRKEIEVALARGKEELEKMKQQLDKVMEELLIVKEQKSSLESQIAESVQRTLELGQKILSATELLEKYKKERDELRVECDNALNVAKELRKKHIDEAPNTLIPRLFSEFSFSEIEEATSNFDPFSKIGEGGYGSIYKGVLCHAEVAIKTLNPESLQGPSEFQQEVNILAKLRHPNLITLIGTCQEASILVYEYLPNGSLEDRLRCIDNNTSPLSWQTRIRIAAELCSVLIFLHFCSPHGIVHGDLKPANILFDENDVSKLGDFGISQVISPNEISNNNTTLCCKTDPMGTFAYMDPEFIATGELTPKSDVYSFGIILLRLLTGRSAFGIVKEVQDAIDKGNLKNLLDPTAGEWPFMQAKELASLALRCCDKNRRRRPDLASEVWRVLETMRISCGVSSF